MQWFSSIICFLDFLFYSLSLCSGYVGIGIIGCWNQSFSACFYISADPDIVTITQNIQLIIAVTQIAVRHH